MSRNAKIPTVVVSLPIFFDFVQPANEIIEINEIIPKKKEIAPTIRGSIRLLSVTSIG